MPQYTLGDLDARVLDRVDNNTALYVRLSEKTCSRCGADKALSDFAKHPQSATKLQAYCRQCANAYRKAMRAANPENERVARQKRAARIRSQNSNVSESDVPLSLHCSGCKRELPRDSFGKNIIGRYGLNYRCRECMRDTGKTYRASHPDAVRRSWASAAAIESKKKSHIKIESTLPGFVSALLRQTSRWDRSLLSVAFLVGLFREQNGKCAITGDVMTHMRPGRHRSNISIDRVDPQVGYDPSNVQLVCVYANTSKAEMSMGELAAFCRKVLTIMEAK